MVKAGDWPTRIATSTPDAQTEMRKAMPSGIILTTYELNGPLKTG